MDGETKAYTPEHLELLADSDPRGHLDTMHESPRDGGQDATSSAAGDPLQFHLDSRRLDENGFATGQQSYNVRDQHMHRTRGVTGTGTAERAQLPRARSISSFSTAPSLKTVAMIGMVTARFGDDARRSIAPRRVQPAAGLGFTRASPQEQVWRFNDVPCCICSI